MNDDKWKDILAKVEENFEVAERDTFELDPGPGKEEYIVFTGPLGKMKLSRVTKPLVTGKKAIGSNRIGSDSNVVYEYSDTEKTHTFTACTWSDSQEDWVEMEAGAFDL